MSGGSQAALSTLTSSVEPTQRHNQSRSSKAWTINSFKTLNQKKIKTSRDTISSDMTNVEYRDTGGGIINHKMTSQNNLFFFTAGWHFMLLAPSLQFNHNL